MNEKRTPASAIALGGVLAAAAVAVMCLGGMIPIATYVCPVICMMVLQVVLRLCGPRISWAWYGVVSILGLLMGPDKEAAAVFLFLGYYPILKPRIEKTRYPWVLKALVFNGAILILYWILLHLLGLDALAEEFSQLGTALTVGLLLLGNLTFFLLDRLLSMKLRKRKK